MVSQSLQGEVEEYGVSDVLLVSIGAVEIEPVEPAIMPISAF